MKLTLKAARVNAGYTQAQAAKQLNISCGTLKNWEKGNNMPSVKYVQPICTLYNVDFNELIFFSNKLAKSKLKLCEENI